MKKFVKYFFIFTFVIGLYVFSTTASATTQAEWQALVKADVQTLKDRGALGGGFNVDNILQPMYNNTASYFILIGSNFASQYTGQCLWVVYIPTNSIYNFTWNGDGLYYWLNNRDQVASDGHIYSVDDGVRRVDGVMKFRTADIDYIYAPNGYFTYDEDIVLQPGEEWGNIYFNDYFEFDPHYNQLVNTASGYLNVHATKYSYSISNWFLGSISSYLEDYPMYHIKLENQLYVSGDWVIAEDYYNSVTGQNSSSDIYVNSTTNRVYIKSRLLRYNVVYTLIIYPETYSGNFSSDNYVGTFIYLPLDATFSGDAIVDAGYGGYDQQDSTNDLLDSLTDTSDIAETLSIVTYSGDSGDILHAMGYFYFSNPFYDFLINVFREIIELFQAQPNNMQLSFTIHGNTYFVQSDDFLIPDSNPLKIFVSSALTVGSIFLIYQYFAKIIYALTCLDIKGVMDGTDVDMSIFM